MEGNAAYEAHKRSAELASRQIDDLLNEGSENVPESVMRAADRLVSRIPPDLREGFAGSVFLLRGNGLVGVVIRRAVRILTFSLMRQSLRCWRACCRSTLSRNMAVRSVVQVVRSTIVRRVSCSFRRWACAASADKQHHEVVVRVQFL